MVAPDRLTQLRGIAAQLTKQLSAINAQIRAIELERFPVKVGDTVIGTRHKYKDRLVRVTKIKLGLGWVMGNPQRKDGSFGKNVIHLFHEWKPINKATGL